MSFRHFSFTALNVIGGLPLALSLTLLVSPLSAKPRPGPVVDRSYVSALATVDKFLQAWQAGDVENGIVLLTVHAKEKVNRDSLRDFFSNSEPSAYEIETGKQLKRGRYEFPVVLVTLTSKNIRVRRRFSSVVVVNTGNNDWAVDKLP